MEVGGRDQIGGFVTLYDTIYDTIRNLTTMGGQGRLLSKDRASDLCLKTFFWLRSDLEGKFNNGFWWVMRYRFGIEMIIEGPTWIRELDLKSTSI